MEENKPKFAYEKKIGFAESMYGDIPFIHNLIGKLLYCMKESNKVNDHKCEYFRLDFRPPYIDEQMKFPIGSLILDLKWGSKQELKE